MKILLAAVNAKYIHLNLALHSLRQYASEFTDHIEICEFTINQYQENIIHEIYRKKPDLLAFSCYIWNISQVLSACRTLRILLPDMPIWLGGPEVSFETEALLAENPWITGVMRGEGEVTFRRLLERYEQSREDAAGSPADPAGLAMADLSGIPGITWRTGDGRIRRGRDLSAEDLPRMDDLPFIYDSLDPALFRHRILYYESSRGCPFSCSYCLSSTEKGIRYRSLAKVFRELRFFLDAQVPQVKLIDRTFNADPGRALKVWEYILEHDNGVTNFHFELEATILTQEELALLSKMRPGLIQTEIGVQSANPRTLRSVHRNPDISKIREYAAVIRNNRNMHLHLDLIAGLPYEDLASFRRSFAEVYGMRPNELQLGFLKLLKGSPIRAEVWRFGIEADPQAPYEVLRTDWLSFDDLLHLKDVEEMLEIYYNSQQFIHSIAALEPLFGDPMALYEALAAWHREHGLSGLQHSRQARYEHLLAFAEEIREKTSCVGPDGETSRGDTGSPCPDGEISCGDTGSPCPDGTTSRVWEEFRELLTIDMYLRENLKSRPSWMRDLSSEREQIRQFYRREEEERRYLPEYADYDRQQLNRMTHLEYFPMRGEWILFDYKNRDPLTQNAAMVSLLRV